MVKNVGHHLMEMLPLHAVIGNMTRRVLKLIREEYASILRVCTYNFSMYGIVLM